MFWVSLDSNNDLKDLALEAISTESVDIVILLSKIGVKTGIVGAVSKKIDLDISKIVGDASQLYGGGASKDPKLSIGGGPKTFDTKEALSFIEKSLLELL